MAPLERPSGGIAAGHRRVVQKVGVRPSGKGPAPVVQLSGEHTEQQQIWIYCAEPDEAADLAAFCRNCRRPKVMAEIVQPRPVDISLRDRLKRCSPNIPAPYTCGEWDDFAIDVDTWLTASIAKKLAVKQAQGQDEQPPNSQFRKWPELFVTDREKLVHVLADNDSLKTMLLESAALSDGQALPLILATDFGMLTGNLVMAPPVELCEPLALQEDILASKCQDSQSQMPPSSSRPASGRPASCSRPASVAAKKVTLRPGVYLSRPSGDISGNKPLYGAQALALLGNGQSAYCALSPDGVRSVEVSGPWEIANGQIVLGAPSKKKACVSHFSLSGSRERRLDITFEELVHLPLDEFEAQFTLLDLKDCMPEGSELLYTGLVKNGGCLALAEYDDEGSVPCTPELVVTSPKRTRMSVILNHQEHTLVPAPGNSQTPPPKKAGRKLLRMKSSPLLEASAGAEKPMRTASNESPGLTGLSDLKKSSRSRPVALEGVGETEAGQVLANALRTPQHALSRIADYPSEAPRQQETLPSPQLEGFQGEFTCSSPAPRLLGVDRGIGRSKLLLRDARGSLDGLGQVPSMDAVVTGGLPFVSAIQRLNSYVASTNGHSPSSPSACPTCALWPGSYRFESGALGEDDYKSFEMVLHADRSCKYHETSNGSQLRSISGATTWYVVNKILVVDTRKGVANGHGLCLRECRASRVVERRATRVKVPIASVLRCCTYVPFEQRSQPFRGHKPAPESHLIFGIIDSNSPVLRTMKCRPERLPYLAFEQELRRHGPPCDKIISDFHFLDRDADGQISVADVRCLETYGSPLAAPEVLLELRDALLQRHGTLESAFEALRQAAPSGNIDLPEFEKFLSQNAEEVARGEKMSAGSHQKMKAWVESTSIEDRAAVFATLNPSGQAAIDLTDFMSMNLHTAVVNLRRLEHLQGWISEQFGRTKESYTQVFSALDKERAHTLTRRAFADGLHRLGYDFAAFANSMFTLLDRSFTGELVVHNFNKICDFSVKDMLMSLEELKHVIDQQFNGVDECYQYMIGREQLLQCSVSQPRTISFNTFQSMCKKIKFSAIAPGADLRMLFLFLDLASGKQRSDGFLTRNEFSLLKGLSSRALAGSPARLCRILKQRYETLDRAFELIHTSWLERALPQGLRQTALTRLARIISAEADGAASAHLSPSSQANSKSVKQKKSGLLPSVSGRKAAQTQMHASQSAGSIKLPQLGSQPGLLQKSFSVPSMLGRA